MNKRIMIIVAIVFVAAIMRLLPHAPNFSPIAAMALFGGAYITNRYLAVIIPLLAMLLSDALMGFNGWYFTEQIIAVYGTFALIAVLGLTLQGNKSAIRVAGASISASVIFFITTNFAVWLGGFFHSPALYTMNGQGLAECFTAGLPFFQNSLMGDLFYNTILFGGFYIASINIPVLQKVN
ncbi:MAG: DUF6580 family putative transport protein [Bacteroidota bacterium]